MGSGQQHPELILGLGRTGRSMARFFCAQGREVLALDDDAGSLRHEARSGSGNCQFLPAASALDNPGRLLSGRKQPLYVSPGVRPDHPLIVQARAHGVSVRTDIDLFMRHCPAPIISVTGTNGKSTVASLLQHLLTRAGLRVHTGGNIGTPALDLLGRGQADYFVLELSSFQLHYATIGDKNHIGILTNISGDHLNFHQSLRNYIRCKRRIFDHNRYSIYFRDQADTRLPCADSNAGFGYGRPARAQDFGLLRSDDGLFLARGGRSLWRLDGELDRPLCFVVNLMPALAVIEYLGFDIDASLEAGLNYPLLDHRYSRVDSDDGICWIDASKATNPHATVHSLPASVNKSILILGGDTKGADMALLNPYLKDIKRVIAYSPEASAIVARLRPDIPTQVCADLSEAVLLSRRCAEAGDVVLLAPGAASQPAYRDYQERGRHFCQLVGGLSAL